MATVMLVTNELNGAHELAAVLRNSGHRVLAEIEGSAALSAMAHDDVDLLATDAVLPDMLGTDLIVLARIHLDRPHLPAVLLSSVPRDIVRDVDRDIAVPVLPMPLSGGQLVDMIADLGLAATEGDARRSMSAGASPPRRARGEAARQDVARRTTSGSDAA